MPAMFSMNARAAWNALPGPHTPAGLRDHAPTPIPPSIGMWPPHILDRLPPEALRDPFLGTAPPSEDSCLGRLCSFGHRCLASAGAVGATAPAVGLRPCLLGGPPHPASPAFRSQCLVRPSRRRVQTEMSELGCCCPVSPVFAHRLGFNSEIQQVRNLFGGVGGW